MPALGPGDTALGQWRHLGTSGLASRAATRAALHLREHVPVCFPWPCLNILPQTLHGFGGRMRGAIVITSEIRARRQGEEQEGGEGHSARSSWSSSPSWAA